MRVPTAVFSCALIIKGRGGAVGGLKFRLHRSLQNRLMYGDHTRKLAYGYLDLAR